MEEKTKPTETEAIESVPSNPNQELNFVQGFAKFMDDGGIFMWIILAMWVFGVIIAVERVKKLFTLLERNL